jgi:DNA end-binding protein Ku
VTFVPRAEVYPVYFNAPYYLYPDGAVATETYRVIAAAMAETSMAGLGRLTLSRRERMVLVEPRGAGMLTTLRAAGEVRPAQFEETAENRRQRSSSTPRSGSGSCRGRRRL